MRNKISTLNSRFISHLFEYSLKILMWMYVLWYEINDLHINKDLIRKRALGYKIFGDEQLMQVILRKTYLHYNNLETIILKIIASRKSIN